MEAYNSSSHGLCRCEYHFSRSHALRGNAYLQFTCCLVCIPTQSVGTSERQRRLTLSGAFVPAFESHRQGRW